MSDRLKINWRAPLCGGFSVHGGQECLPNELTGQIDCKCVSKPNNFNYEIHFIIAASVYAKRMHIDKNCDRWDAFVASLFTDNGALKKYQQVQGKTMKERFFSTMVDEVSKRHGVGKFAEGREAHPDISRYDRIMLTMIKEMEQIEAAKKLEREKKERKQSSMLAHEGALCPPIVNMTKRTSQVLDEEGEVVEDEIELFGASESDTPQSSTSRSTSSTEKPKKKPKKQVLMDSDDQFLSVIMQLTKGREEEMRLRERQIRNQELMMMFIFKQNGMDIPQLE